MKKKRLLIIFIPIVAVLLVTAIILVIKINSSKKSGGDYVSEYYPYMNFCATEEGLLYLDTDMMLHFTDLKSEMSTYVCSKPNCEHSSGEGSECDACIRGVNVNFVMDSNYIYLIGDSRGRLYYDDEISGYIIRQSRDGSKKEQVVEYKDIQNIFACKLYNNYIVMAYLNDMDYTNPLDPVELEDEELGIAIYNTDTGEFSQNLIVKENLVQLADLDIYNGIIYCAYEYKTDEEGSWTSIYCSIDADGWETEELLVRYGIPQEHYFTSVRKNCFLYSDNGKVYIYMDGNTIIAGNGNAAIMSVLIDDEIIYYNGEEWIRYNFGTSSADTVTDEGTANDVWAQIGGYVWYLDGYSETTIPVKVIKNSYFIKGRWDKAKTLCKIPRGGADTVVDDFEDNSEDDGRTELVWVTPDYGRLTQKQVRNINDILKDKGYDFKIKLVKLNVYENYPDTLKEYLDENDADIVFGGLTFQNGQNDVVDIIEEGLLYDLTDELKSGKGSELYNYYDEVLWKADEYNGSIYIIPSTAGSVGSVPMIVFNDKYVSQEDLNDFDGTIGGLKDLYEKCDAVGCKIVFDVSRQTLVDYMSTDYFLYDGIVISNSENKAYSIADCDKLKEQYSTLNEFYNSGNLVELDEKTTFEAVEDSYFAYITNIKSSDMPSDISYQYEVVVKSIMSMGYGISASGTHKEQALEMLTLAMTDSDIANAFIYGIEGVDYTEENGIVYVTNGDGIMNETAYGMYVAADKTEYDNIAGTRYDNAKLEWDNMSVSKYHDLFWDMSDYTVIIQSVVDINETIPICTDDNFDEACVDYAQSLEEVGISELVDVFNRQLEQYDADNN